ncbi:hypothetical protein CONPUDRAFT_32186, partial [Coniophora puteana RWD-64-598 SS2]
VIWALVEDLWCLQGTSWPDLTIGIVLGCGLINFRTTSKKPDEGASRLFKILVAESVYLIWILEWECQKNTPNYPDGAHSPEEVKRRWYARINHHLEMDKMMVDRFKVSRHTLERK